MWSGPKALGGICPEAFGGRTEDTLGVAVPSSLGDL